MIQKMKEISMDKLIIYVIVTILTMLGGWVTLTVHNQSKVIVKLSSNLDTINDYINLDRSNTQHISDQFNNRIDLLTTDQKEILKLLIQIQRDIR